MRSGTATNQESDGRSATGNTKSAVEAVGKKWKGMPRLMSWLLFVVLLGLWEIAGVHWPAVQKLLSSPILVAERVVQMVGDGSLWTNLLPTLEETLGGLVIGLIVGGVGGVVMARSPLVATVIDPYVVGLNGLPRVALGPFFVVWFGIGILSKILLAVSVVFVVVLFNIRAGVEGIDQDLVDALRSMHATPWQMVRHVVFPSLLPWILASLKIGIGLALTGAVVGELVGASAGLGWQISESLNFLDMTGAVTALLIMAFVAMVLYYIVLIIERRVLAWRSETSSWR